MNAAFKVLEFNILGTPLWGWVAALLLTLILMLIFRLLQKGLSAKLGHLSRKHESAMLSFVAEILRQTLPLVVLVLALWLSASLLFSVPARIQRLIDGIALFASFLQVAFWGDALITFFISQRIARARTEDVSRTSTFYALSFLLKAALWVIILLLVLENFGINVTALMTGLGIGGVAIALAVQNILGDLLCSVSILLDKPFEVGDLISVGDKQGVVERIGIKSTRLTSLQGEQLVISNSDLIKSRIQNFKRMNARHIVFPLSVVYQAPEKVEQVSKLLQEIIESVPKTRFECAHLVRLSFNALDFEIAYSVLDRSYHVYMDIQQKINLEILRRFAKADIALAHAQPPPPPPPPKT